MRREIKYEGDLKLNGFIIPCYVLDDGTRVISGGQMQEALKLFPETANVKSGSRLSRLLGYSGLQELIVTKFETGHFEPIVCYNGNQKINGYEATVLADICELLLDARKAGLLKTDRQKQIADQAETLMRAFARVGIIALVDEATGYQYERERDELQKILKAYISPELLPWQKKFPDVYYKELFRLNGWDYTVKGIKKRPGVIGKWTNTLIYNQLPKDVLKTLKEKTPKSDAGNYTARLFQSLTPDVGEPHLTAQLNQINTLFMLSDNMSDMWSKFEKLKLRQSGHLELPFQFDEKGHTKEPIYEENKLSDFNGKLKQALDYKPAKK